MVVSPALQRGERGEQERPSPVGAAQISKFVVKIAFMRLPWSDGWEQAKSGRNQTKACNLIRAIAPKKTCPLQMNRRAWRTIEIADLIAGKTAGSGSI